MRGTHGWAEVSRERKREIIQAIVTNRPTRGPVHIEIDLTDRCNVACYFCNQQDLRTKEAIPLPRVTDLVDELAASGLKSVRLSGGGDPLFHRDAASVIAHLTRRGVVVDNLTTNGVALTAEIASLLVANQAREVIISLNAADAGDYARMMQVKPALFDQVVANAKKLLEIRGRGIHPSLVVQFLIDKRNLHRLVDMYELARSIGPDRVAIGGVLEIPNDRIDHDILLTPEDSEIAEPLLEEILRRDRETGLVQIDFPVYGWNAMIARVRERLATPAHNTYPIAPSFTNENGGCFFAWYTAAITGTGDIRPCCLMLNTSVRPLGNIHEKKTFAEQWNGPEFARMRTEMRDVMLSKNTLPWSPERFATLKEPCVKDGLCWLKNMYFRADEEFYAELGEALTKARRNMERKLAVELFLLKHPRMRALWDSVRNGSRPVRVFLKQRFGVNLTDAA